MRKPKSRGAITLRIALAMLILWAVLMWLMVDFLAWHFWDLAIIDGEEYADRVGQYYNLDEIYTKGSTYIRPNPELDTWKDFDMLYALSAVNNPTDPATDWQLHMQTYFGEEVAAVICDKDGNILYECGDYLAFEIISEEDWEESWFQGEVVGHGMISLEPGAGNEEIAEYIKEYSHTDKRFGFLRITGYRDGMTVKPVKLEYVTGDQVPIAGEEDKHNHHALVWQTLFDDTAETDPEGLETFYTGQLVTSIYNPAGKIKTRYFEEGILENDHSTLLGVLRDGARILVKGNYLSGTGTGILEEIIVFDTKYYPLDGSVDVVYTPYADFVLVTASVYRPMKLAVLHSFGSGLVTLLLGVVLTAILSWSVNRNLIWHVRRVNQLISEGWPAAEFGDLEPWEEAAQLQRNYHKTVGLRQKDKNEIARLETALSYAKEAEDNRRQMVSAIAHELKTPLAVVHSYAEGLQEKIAEEKREQYLQTILTETERMDGMVMEMLDLSRLEAGKVKLARDRFDLGEMVKDTFEKLQPMAEEKKLLIQLQLKENCMVNADEGRIAQAVMNLASNAVRYTPVGGNITVTLGLVWRQTVLTVANDCENFTEEELEKVWESFYRRDKSRDRKGTGLGLAITRQIVQLHSGSCYVKNTDTGVEFGIKLPN